MRYVSLFSGAGGLEARGIAPALCCDIDEPARELLARRFPDAEIVSDVRDVQFRGADVVVGGWPCQDISVAGKRDGLRGERSGLFYELLRVARESRATTIVAENVPNLLTMESGLAMLEVLRALEESGFPFTAWRTLNARAFGLPHQRRRIFLVASRDPAVPPRLHRKLPRRRSLDAMSETVGSYYTTAGLHSICYSEGYTPTLKVGSSLSIPSPPGVYFRGITRKLTANECLRLQGFKPGPFRSLADKDKYRLAGNAVAVPAGQFAVATAQHTGDVEVMVTSHSRFGPNGMYDRGKITEVAELSAPTLAVNLSDFIDTNLTVPLSEKAASGLLNRLAQSGKPCPPGLLMALCKSAGLDEIPDTIASAAENGTRRRPRTRTTAPTSETMF